MRFAEVSEILTAPPRPNIAFWVAAVVHTTNARTCLADARALLMIGACLRVRRRPACSQRDKRPDSTSMYRGRGDGDYTTPREKWEGKWSNKLSRWALAITTAAPRIAIPCTTKKNTKQCTRQLRPDRHPGRHGVQGRLLNGFNFGLSVVMK